MVNINTALPPAIAVPFHPPTEALQRDNSIKPVIPKAEVVASYAKLREEEDKQRFSDQARSIVQDENEQNNNPDDHQQPQSNAQRRRLNLFANSVQTESDSEGKALEIMNDFRLAILAIQEKYNRAVTPIPNPNIDFML